MIVAGARHSNLKLDLLKTDDAARAGGKTDGGLDAMLVEDLMPFVDLLARRQLAPGQLGDKMAEHIIIPGLVARPQCRRAQIPRRF